MEQAHLFITGHVQGVGYRQFIKSKARKAGLTGWVQNLPDGRVEGVVQGQRKQIEKLLRLCRRGPFLAKVTSVDVSWKEARTLFNDFTVHKS